MGQISFSDAEYAGKRKKTRREVFLAEMERIVPWSRLEAAIAPWRRWLSLPSTLPLH